MSDLLRIAVSGLVAQQGALNVTGNNISNVNTEGYSRQRLELGTQPSQFLNGNFFGSGVQLETVRRVVDEFTIQQLRTDTWVYSGADRLRYYSEQIDSILNDEVIGISTRINSFFDALQAAADDPSWIPNRQVVISEAETLSNRFNSLYDRLAQLNTTLNQEIGSLTRDADSLAESIASLNLKIDQLAGIGTPDQVNDLLDKRDQALLDLAEIVDIRTVRDGNSVNVFLGKGQALVIGGQASDVVQVQDRFDPTRSQIAVVISGQTRVVSDDTTGGKIGGILDFRTRILDESFASLGRVALGIAATVNEQSQLGLDLNNRLGGLVFGDVNDATDRVLRARSAADNDPTSTGVVNVAIDDVSALTTSSYQLDITGPGQWRLIRNSDNAVVGTGSALSDTLVTVDGFTVQLNVTGPPPGNFVTGDSFLIEPTRSGARSFSTVIERPEDLALAQPARLSAGTGNVGSGVAAGSNAFDVSDPLFATTPQQLAPPLLIRFTSPTTFDVLDNTDPNSPVALAPPLTGLSYTPGVSNTLFSTTPGDPDYFGLQVTISGNPAAGDTFRVDYNSDASSDNRNGLALARLQIADSLVGGTTSFQGAYGQLVGFVGTETRQARIDSQASEAVLNQTRETREATSGVNLDEEAANLIRFEQAYNASAQVISVARSIIDALFEAVR